MNRNHDIIVALLAPIVFVLLALLSVAIKSIGG